MNNSERAFVNTFVQYIKTIISLLLSLYTTRILLSSLGVEDYGIYTLIGGVISLLGFAINAFVISTQRFLSYNSNIGKSDKLKMIFSNSLFVHIVFGVIITVFLELIGPILINSFLEIPYTRRLAAIQVYHVVPVMIFLSFVSSPFRALLISRENIPI